MSDDTRIRQLVEEILESKRTPEEVCSDTPDLLPAVCKRLEQIQRLRNQLDEMFGDEDRTQDGDDPIPENGIES